MSRAVEATESKAINGMLDARANRQGLLSVPLRNFAQAERRAAATSNVQGSNEKGRSARHRPNQFLWPAEYAVPPAEVIVEKRPRRLSRNSTRKACAPSGVRHTLTIHGTMI